MKQLALLLPLAACAHPAAPAADPLPAPHRAVQLMSDQLMTLASEPRLKDGKYDDRLGYARNRLGTDGDETPDGASFVAIGTATERGPYSCQELVVGKAQPLWQIRETKIERCGLAPLKGRGPYATVGDLRALATQVVNLDPLTSEQTVQRALGRSDHPNAPPPEWIGIGPRGQLEDAPVSCWVLTIGAPASSPTRVWEAPLERCGLGLARGKPRAAPPAD